ncbi:ABC transporter transmembrane domain-containing protein, partial [Pseudomonas viridiflava]|uniref:ABC transporter transmembrane domain-containing protein n=1 Tax=Pseudomonas viridiflava TaxID=33069 RepID=UPI00178333D3
MSFFQQAKAGEIVERVKDLERVQRFASVELVDALTGAVSIISLSLLLLWIEGSIFLIFAGSAIAYLVWIHVVGSHRRQLDVDRFRENSR